MENTRRTIYQYPHIYGKASDAVGDGSSNEPFRYDLVNTGREILAQIAGLFVCQWTDRMESTRSVRSISFDCLNHLNDDRIFHQFVW